MTNVSSGILAAFLASSLFFGCGFSSTTPTENVGSSGSSGESGGQSGNGGSGGSSGASGAVGGSGEGSAGSASGATGGSGGVASGATGGSGGVASGATGGSGAAESGATGGSGAAASGAMASSGTAASGAMASSGAAASGAMASSGAAASGAMTGTCGPVGAPADDLVAGSNSVLQRGHDIYRQSTFAEAGLTATTAGTMAPDTMFNTNATFPANGNMQNQGTPSVLYLEDGPAGAGCPTGATGCTATGRAAGAGVYIAFAALNSTPNVFAFDETTGEPVWTAHVAPGGAGIRGTPVIDATARRIYISTGDPHQLHAVSVDTGVEVTTGGWPVATPLNEANAENDGDENQHGALLEANGIVYIPFGGQYGDGGTYKGAMIAVNTTTGAVNHWETDSSRSGIWGAGGLVSDGSSVFGVTGDTGTEARAGSDSQEVVRLTGMASFTRCAQDVFVPVEAPNWDRPAGDLDFGASTPAFVALPAGSNPSSLLVAPAKAGRLFVLNATNLSNGTYDTTARTGNANAPLADLVVSGTTGETVYTSPTIYTTSSGLHATINVGGGSQNCPGGAKNNEVIVSTLITPGTTPIASGEAWCAQVANGGGHMNFPPISTTSDGVSANPLVWFMDGSQLRAVNGDTGANVVTTTGAACNGVPSMSFPIAVKNRVVVWAVGHLCSWSPGGN